MQCCVKGKNWRRQSTGRKFRTVTQRPWANERRAIFSVRKKKSWEIERNNKIRVQKLKNQNFAIFLQVDDRQSVLHTEYPQLYIARVKKKS